ncbi:MAG: LysR family transcriptional regulator [Chthoniobacteraceae bacterium]
MEWLNLHHLRYFYVVAREGTLRKAAERLGVSQPSISAQLRLLEESLGEPLFRRTGRSLVLSDTGQVVLHYAETIFGATRELLSAVRQQTVQRASPVLVGITDTVPKIVAGELLKPMFALGAQFRVVCREGKFDELLAQLAVHRLDIILADEPAPTSVKVKTFNHPLGSCGVMWFAEPGLAGKLRRKFPESLRDQPALLPSENTSLRMLIERWFDGQNVRPQVLAEFDDSALMEAVAGQIGACFPLHSVVKDEALKRYGFRVVGEASDCRADFYAITAERRIKHPAVVAVTAHAQTRLFA